MLSWVPMAAMTCRAAGEGLQVIQLVEAAFLQRHDPAGQVGGVRLGRAGRGRRHGGGGDRLVQLGRGPRGRRRRGADVALLLRRPGGAAARPRGRTRRPRPRRAGRSGPPWPGPWPAPRAARASSRSFSAASFAIRSARSASACSWRARALGLQLRLRRLAAGQLARRPLPGRPGRGPAGPAAGTSPPLNRASSAASAARACSIHACHLGFQQLLQLRDIQPQLLRGRVRGHRRVRLDLGAVPGRHVDPDQALPRARRQRLHQQPLQRLLVPGHEPGVRGVIGVQPAADHPRAHVIEGGHLDRPRGPDPLAVAVHDQRHHHPRVIRRPALPVGPVARPGTAPGPARRPPAAPPTPGALPAASPADPAASRTPDPRPRRPRSCTP